jgi:5'-methylthioadenosine phosphorylase
MTILNTSSTTKKSGVGVIGGSGIYKLEELKDVTAVKVTTPFGDPSSPVLCGKLGNQEVFFIARHGLHHSLLPSEINYAANIYALKSLGVDWCISVGAGGSLVEKFRFGDIVVPDQIIDFTKSRVDTFFGEGLCVHISLTDPYCRILNSTVVHAAKGVAHEQRFAYHNGGTYCCVEGPSHRTRAESIMMKNAGGSVVGMTAMPEARLAREAEMAYASIVMITDYDIFDEEDREAVPSDDYAFEILQNCVQSAKDILVRTIPQLGGLRPDRAVRDALEGSIVTNLNHVPKETLEALKPIIGRYLTIL